ncbi:MULTISPECIES: DUF2945 domain-containing protein [unclassified Achromobacter]|jgi:hypothetical protein|uniref:DUF2945 domain-containing protein n=1 Tax=unclassified Achromobacter TaxID=2626865 RepID=UPI000B5155DF|nr:MULTISPECIES: DUF2945 domain-containing protein [unclassified Achromobacter]OWT69139.1 hypothetical protein CEY05_28300 [Achromobacter sp. HZ34]OWT70544.1 hypothetical protein CEY04_27130 [Achromobacter sp. HZ28]
MTKRFKVGDHVHWNSDAGWTVGTITAVHRRDFDFMGRTRRASTDDPQYEVKSAKTGHLAAHKGSALRRSPPRSS